MPRDVIREGFIFRRRRISFGSLYSGIHRAKEQQGPAALSVYTAVNGPYDDFHDRERRVIHYRYRAGDVDQRDNRWLRAAFDLQTPLIYFRGIGSKQYQVIAPVFIVKDDPISQSVMMEIGLPFEDTQGEGIVSSQGARREQYSMVVRRSDQVLFRREVLNAYQNRCAVCSLKEPQLVEAAHIIDWAKPEGIASVVNGIALCAIHHLAYDRNLLGIDPRGVVHIGERLLNEIDGPMLKSGLQGFHGAAILRPRKPANRPDPDRLAVRFEEFVAVA